MTYTITRYKSGYCIVTPCGVQIVGWNGQPLETRELAELLAEKMNAELVRRN